MNLVSFQHFHDELWQTLIIYKLCPEVQFCRRVNSPTCQLRGKRKKASLRKVYSIKSRSDNICR